MRTSVDVKTPHNSASATEYDATVVGAGPYGLSVAAHLKERGLKVAIFGKPLSLWRDHMPTGMLLRSYWWATSLSAPRGRYDFAHYFQEHGQKAYDPLSREVVIDYGLWFQKQAVPYLDETYVKSVKRESGQFRVELEDGRVLQSRAVVMAPGLHYYTYRPDEYAHLPAELVSHTSDHETFERFVGKRVIVIGRGQGALETAALAHESGVDIQVVSRHAVYWIAAPQDNLSLRQRLRGPQAGTGRGWFDWRLEHMPYRFQRLERSKKDQLLAGAGSFGPMGAHWLRDRVVGKFPLHEMQTVQEIKELDGGVQLGLANGQKLTADHIFLGTGYRVDIKKLPMLDPTLVAEVETYQNAPVLNSWFETSVPGLYFVGISSLSSFGPFYRFIVGAKAAAKRVSRGVERTVSQKRQG
jgi:thioredoxin reductase